MTRFKSWMCAVLVSGSLLCISHGTANAYFPPFDPIVVPEPPVVIPPIGPPPVDPQPPVVPPDPFTPPGIVGVGDPEPTDPETKPIANTPEPASLISGAMGLGVIAIWRLRRRKSK